MIANQPPKNVSIVIPAFNEGTVVAEVLSRLDGVMRSSGLAYEIVVVDDGSEDETLLSLQSCPVPITLLHNPVNMGYGFSLKRGIRAAKHDVSAITDADGTYPLETIPSLVEEMSNADMVVGARTGAHFRGSFLKGISRRLFHAFAHYITGVPIPDINSGLRVFKKDLVSNYERHISSGFSFTTTITLIAFLTHRFVKYIPIAYGARAGKSKVHMLRDTLRSAQILVETLLVYNPTKVFLLLSLIPFLTAFFFLPLLAFKSLSNIAVGLIAGVTGSCLVLGLGFIAVILSRSRGE